MSFKYKVKKISKFKECSIIISSSYTDIRGNISTIFNSEMQKKIIKKKI